VWESALKEKKRNCEKKREREDMRTFVLFVCLGLALVLVAADQRRIDHRDENTIFFQQDPQMRLIEVNEKQKEKQTQTLTQGNALGVGERIHLKDYSMGVNTNGLFTINLQEQEMISVDSEGTIDMDADLYCKKLHVDEDLVVGGISQWRLVRSDIFTDKTLKTEWKYETYLQCPLIAMIATTRKAPITYTYENLPPHTQVRISATVHIIDDWQGETAYLKLNDEYVWTSSHGHETKGHSINICGSPLYEETSFSLPIDVAIWNTEKNLHIEFGTTLDPSVTAHLGLSSINLHVRESDRFTSGGSKEPNKDRDPSYPDPFADSKDKKKNEHAVGAHSSHHPHTNKHPHAAPHAKSAKSGKGGKKAPKSSKHSKKKQHSHSKSKSAPKKKK